MIRNVYSSDSLSDSLVDLKTMRKNTLLRCDSVDSCQHSIIGDMRRFNSAVQNMEDTILVPSRLRDMEMTSYSETTDNDVTQRGVTSLLRDCDAYDAFHVLRAARAQLHAGNGTPVSSSKLRHRRSLSAMSAHSLCSELSEEDGSVVMTTGASSSFSQLVQSAGAAADDDSGVEECSTSAAMTADSCACLQRHFTRHLHALCGCLGQMSQLAEFLSGQYEQQLNASA